MSAVPSDEVEELNRLCRHYAKAAAVVVRDAAMLEGVVKEQQTVRGTSRPAPYRPCPPRSSPRRPRCKPPSCMGGGGGGAGAGGRVGAEADRGGRVRHTSASP